MTRNATSAPPPIKTRKPTGRAPWPFLALAGVEKSGKTWAATMLSASDLVGRTFFVEVGEGAADQYGALPGVRYEIVEHDGSYQGILGAVQAAAAQPREDGKPNAIILDSGTELWDMLSEEQAIIARRRAEKKGRRVSADEDPNITVDQWIAAKKRWRRVMDAMRTHNGPAIVTARLELVNIVDGQGRPTGAKEWKVRGEKNLTYEVDAIIEFRERQKAALSGVRSAVLNVPDGQSMPLPGFSLDKLLRDLGLDKPDAARPRTYVAPDAEAGVAEQEAAALPKPEQVQAEIDDAKKRYADEPMRLAGALMAVGNRYGRDTLAQVTLDTAKGPTAADVVVDGLVGYYRSKAQEAQAGEKPQPAGPANAVPADEQRALLLAELDFQAEVRNTTPGRLVERWEQSRSKSFDQATVDEARDLVARGRETAIRALRQAGRTDEADRYQELADAPVIDRLRERLRGDADQPAAVPEPPQDGPDLAEQAGEYLRILGGQPHRFSPAKPDGDQCQCGGFVDDEVHASVGSHP